MLVLLLATTLIAQIDKDTKNPRQKIVNEELEAKIDNLLNPLNNTISPGCAVTVIHNGNLIAKKAYGMANLENQVSFTHKTVVRMPYSEGREFIAIAAVLMEQDGILKLDDKVRKYFPELPQWAEPVTLWDILNHRSGFADEWATLLLTQASMANRFDKSQFLQFLYNQPTPAVEPGKGYLYSNSDFGLLRLILEKASGKNLPEWLEARVFKPLKMSSTRMQSNPLEIIPNKAIVYSAVGNRKYEQARVSKTSPGGNYFILTNAEDLERWSAAHNDSTSEIANAAARLLDNVRTMPGKDKHYIVGYSKRKIKDQTVFLHEGVNEFNYLTRIPDMKLSVITLGNFHGEGCDVENKAITNFLLGVTEPPPPTFLTKPISVTKDELSKYEGRYLWENQVSWQSNTPVRVFSNFFVADGVLKLRYRPNYLIDLIPVGKDVFYFNDGFGMQIKFSRNAGGTPDKVEVQFDDGFPGVTMVKDTIVSWQPSKAELTAFTGKYYSRHLDFYWTVELNKEGKLIIKRPTIADTVIEADGLNQFHFKIESYPGVSSDAWVLFHKNQKGRITHLTVWSQRNMHHRFDRIGAR